MKYLIAFLAALMFILNENAFSQTVNGVPIENLGVEYIRIYNGTVGWNPPIYIDFGQGRISESNSKSNILKDENRQSINFSSMLDALNFLAKYGFELVEAYVAAYDDHRDVHFYILRRNKSD